MIDQDLPFAVLAGMDSVLLSLQYGYYSSSNYADLVVELQAPECEFTADQNLQTCACRLDDPAELNNLIENPQGKRFEIDALHFAMEISYLELGMRTGYLAQLEFNTILPLSDKPWPKTDTIAEYMLLEANSIGHLKFSFRCEEPELRAFQRQLAEMYNKAVSANGR